jgi:glycosyltransferase involved in cell wall biosynthesis
VLAHAATIEAGEPEHLEACPRSGVQLDEAGRLDAYWAAAQRLMKPDTVLFTGYLTHREMAWLLPCCDVAIFPSHGRRVRPARVPRGPRVGRVPDRHVLRRDEGEDRSYATRVPGWR